GQRLRTLEFGLELDDVGVEQFGAGCHTDGETLPHYATRLGGRGNGFVAGGHRGTAGLDIELSLPHLDGDPRVEFGHARGQGVGLRAGARALGARAAAVPERPVHVDAEVPGRLP